MPLLYRESSFIKLMMLNLYLGSLIMHKATHVLHAAPWSVWNRALETWRNMTQKGS